MAVACQQGAVQVAIIDMLRGSLDVTPVAESNVVDFEVEKLSRIDVNPKDVLPEKLLALAQADCKDYGNVIGCYVTLIRDDGSGISTVNYRAGLSRTEELAYRQIGVQETIDLWKVGG